MSRCCALDGKLGVAKDARPGRRPGVCLEVLAVLEGVLGVLVLPEGVLALPDGVLGG